MSDEFCIGWVEGKKDVSNEHRSYTPRRLVFFPLCETKSQCYLS